jgi:exosortase
MLFGAAILALVVVNYHFLGNTVENVNSRSVFVWMAARWGDRASFGADYSIGWLIPAICGWLLWRIRRQLAVAPRQVCTPALAAVMLALLLHWVGARIAQPRISLVGLVLLLWSVPWYLYGREIAKLIVFPCGYLLFCVPWNFLDSFTFPLRLFSSVLAAWVLNGFGFAVVRSGTVIRSETVQGLDFNVADPCSGLSSMLAMAALTALYAYLTQRTFARKTVLFAMSLPLAILGNVFRIGVIAAAAVLFGKDTAVRIYHEYSPFLIFPVAILLMIGCGSLVANFTPSKLMPWKRKNSKPA